jgi:hypothetical protein
MPMKLEDHGSGMTFLCDACGVPVRGTGVVGLRHREQVIVHDWCRPAFDQFFHNGARRTLSLGQFVDELVAASEP